jgi:hypothetical protein
MDNFSTLKRVEKGSSLAASRRKIYGMNPQRSSENAIKEHLA